MRRPGLSLARWSLLPLVIVVALVSAASAGSGRGVVFRIDRVTDGDTVVLRNEQRVRLVQIDSPEKFFGLECYAREASDAAERLLPKVRGCDSSSSRRRSRRRLRSAASLRRAARRRERQPAARRSWSRRSLVL